MQMSGLLRNPLIFTLFIGSIAFLGLSALIMWNNSRPGETDPNAVAQISPEAGDNAEKYATRIITVEDQTVLLRSSKNDQMVLYATKQPEGPRSNVANVTPEPPASETPTQDVVTAPDLSANTNTPTLPVVLPSSTPTPILATATHTRTPVPSSNNTGSGQTILHEHIAAPGDTLYSLACEHDASIAMLSSRLKAEDLTTDNPITLVIPNFNFCPASAPYEYAIQEGDTVFNIGRLIGEKPERLRELNLGLGTMGNQFEIEAGKVICLPKKLDRC